MFPGRIFPIKNFSPDNYGSSVFVDCRTTLAAFGDFFILWKVPLPRTQRIFQTLTSLMPAQRSCVSMGFFWFTIMSGISSHLPQNSLIKECKMRVSNIPNLRSAAAGLTEEVTPMPQNPPAPAAARLRQKLRSERALVELKVRNLPFGLSQALIISRGNSCESSSNCSLISTSN